MTVNRRRQPSLLQILAAFLFGSDNPEDEIALDAFRGYRDPNEDAHRSRCASLDSAAQGFRPN